MEFNHCLLAFRSVIFFLSSGLINLIMYTRLLFFLSSGLINVYMNVRIQPYTHTCSICSELVVL
jgi:hypothetical protein